MFCARSSRQEVDGADGGGAEGVRDETAGRAGGDGQGQEAEGGPGHPLPGSGCVALSWFKSSHSPVGNIQNTQTFMFCFFYPGVFDECDTEVDVLHWSRHNIFLLYDMGLFTALLELLSMEIE